MSTVNRTAVSVDVSRTRFPVGLDSGTCFSFDGTDGKIAYVNPGTFDRLGALTICGRFKSTKAATNSFGSQVMIGTRWCYIHIRQIAGIDTLLIRCDNAGAVQAGGAVVQNRWYSFIAEYFYSSSNTTIYMNMMIDGIPTSTISSTLPYNEKFYFIGSDGSNYFQGEQDDIQIFTRKLTASEKIAYTRGQSIDLNGCVLKYNANEGSGVRAMDTSGSNNHGVIIGGCTYTTDKVFSVGSRLIASSRQSVTRS